MRIVCQKCSAAYAIDDKFVTEKGVRAQCPRCRHLQMVKKGDAPAADAAAPAPVPAPPAAASNPFSFDPPTSPAMSRPAAPTGGSPFDFDFAAPPRAAAPAPAPVPVTLSAPTTRSPFDFDLVAPPAPPAPAPLQEAPPPARAPSFPAAPPAPLPLPEFPPAAPAAPAFGAPFDFGAPPPPGTAADLDALTGGPASAPAGATCKSCGKSISDPFDVALGTCDECRSKQQTGVDGPTPDSNAGKSERVDVAAISNSLRSPEPAPAAAHPAPAPAPPPMSVAQTTAVRSAMRDTARENQSRTIAGVVGVVLVLALVGGGLYWKKPWVRRPPRVTTTTAAGAPKAIEEIVQKWKLNYPELADEASSEAKSHVERGEEHLARDTTAGYREAEEEFEKALVLDSSNDRALAGWVLAIAFGRGGEIDELTSKAADSMLTAAEQRSGAAALYVAHAHFDIARGVNANDVQHRAEIGKNSKDPRDKALAALAIGQAQLTKNAQTAEQHFKEALALDPKLKRAYLFQANLAISLGKYREAAEALEKRLSLDGDQWEASETLARLLIEVGEPARARKVLEEARAAAPKSARPRIALAQFQYQHQGDFAAAADALTAVTVDPDTTKKEQADAYLHLGIVRRLQGELDRARDAFDKALEAQPDHLPVRVQQVVLLTDRGVASQARLTLDSLKGKLPAALETLLEGRLLILEGRPADAVTVLTALADKDPGQVAAVLLAGAAAAKARKDGKAWELCLKRGLRMDPLANPVQALTQLYVRQADVLRQAQGAWSGLGAGNDEDPNPFLCEGLVAWFSDDTATAEKHFARVTNIDPRSADGYAFRALLALKRRDVGTAMTQASRAVGANKNHALAHYSLAVSAMAANKADLGKIEAIAANKAGPSLLGPRVIMGDVEARQKNEGDARRLLTSVLLADPTFREAKKALYKQSL